MPIATTNTLGCIKVDNSTINIDEYGIISSAPAYGDSDVTNYLLNLDTHIIPDTDNAYDIGSVEKKIRELFVSNNSIWMGETHKIVIKDDKIKFKKINKNVIPTRLKSLGNVNDADIFSFFNNTVSSRAELSLSQWLQYGKSKDSNIRTINDVFQDDDNNFEEEISTDIWQTHTSNIILHSDYHNIGIGTIEPGEKLHVIGNTKIEGTLTVDNLDVIGTSTQINTQTYTSENLLIDNTDTDDESLKIYHNNANYDIMSIYSNDLNSINVFKIKKDGSIGIGTTPSSKLHVHYPTNNTGIRLSTNSQAYYLYNSDNVNSGGAGFSIQNITDSGKVPFRIKGSGEILLSAFDNKNVGIGTSSPDYPLHIKSFNNKGIRVDCDNNDVEILRFTPNDNNPTSYGGALKYYGTGNGNDKKFSITMDNQTGTNIDAITVLQNGNTTFSAESKFNDKVGINSGSKTLIVPLQVGPGTNTSGFTSRSSVAILSGDSGGPNELCALSLINSRQAALGTACSLGFNLSIEWGPSSKIKAISTGTNVSSDLTFETHTGSSLTEKMRISNNGYVGIGTSEPITILNIHNTMTDGDSTIRPSNSGTNEYVTESLWLGKGRHNGPYNYWGLSVGTRYDDGASYLQVLNKNSAVYYNLLLQPHGGKCRYWNYITSRIITYFK